MTFLWILFAVISIGIFVWMGVNTLRRGHLVLFVLGFFVPILWIVGASAAGPNDARLASPAETTTTP